MGSPGVQYMDAGAFLPRFLRSVSEKINLCCQEKMLDINFERMPLIRACSGISAGVCDNLVTIAVKIWNYSVRKQ